MGNLTEHFSDTEFGWPRGASLPPGLRHQYRELCVTYLEPLRREFGRTTVYSGLRSPEHNREVGGAPQSFHMQLPGRRGVAADVACERGTPAAWRTFLERLNPPGLGAYPTHVHVDSRAGHARW